MYKISVYIFIIILTTLYILLGVTIVTLNVKITSLNTKITALQTKQNQIISNNIAQTNKLIKILEQFNLQQVKTLTVTAYTPHPNETDNTPTITASMQKVRAGTVAVSRDLFKQGWVFGKKVYIEQYGIFTINDLMNERYNNRIDVFMWNKKQAHKFGKKKLVVALLQI